MNHIPSYCTFVFLSFPRISFYFSSYLSLHIFLSSISFTLILSILHIFLFFLFFYKSYIFIIFIFIFPIRKQNKFIFIREVYFNLCLSYFFFFLNFTLYWSHTRQGVSIIPQLQGMRETERLQLHFMIFQTCFAIRAMFHKCKHLIPRPHSSLHMCTSL